MFAASRFLARGPARFAAAKKNFATTSFKEKTFKQAWCSDPGAYPVMGVIVFAVVFCSATMVYFVATHPDSRVSKTSRKALFRGELKDEKPF